MNNICKEQKLVKPMVVWLGMSRDFPFDMPEWKNSNHKEDVYRVVWTGKIVCFEKLAGKDAMGLERWETTTSIPTSFLKKAAQLMEATCSAVSANVISPKSDSF